MYEYSQKLLNHSSSLSVTSCDVTGSSQCTNGKALGVSRTIFLIRSRQLDSGSFRVRTLSLFSREENSSCSGRVSSQGVVVSVVVWKVEEDTESCRVLKSASCTTSSKDSRFVSLSLPFSPDPSIVVISRYCLVQLRSQALLRRSLTLRIRSCSSTQDPECRCMWKGIVLTVD